MVSLYSGDECGTVMWKVDAAINQDRNFLKWTNVNQDLTWINLNILDHIAHCAYTLDAKGDYCRLARWQGHYLIGRVSYNVIQSEKAQGIVKSKHSFTPCQQYRWS